MKIKLSHEVLNGLGVVALLLLMAAGFSVYLAPHFGWRIDAVRSESMSPELTRGTLVVAQPVTPEQINLNDIIIFHPTDGGNSDVVHRVVAIHRNSPLAFRTKGDAYILPDLDIVPGQNVSGRVLFHVPAVGYIALFMKTPVGFLVTVVIPGITVAYMCLAAALSEAARKKKGARGA